MTAPDNRPGRAGRPLGSTAPKKRPEAHTVDQWHGLGYLTPAEAAERTGLAPSTIYNRIRAGALGGTRGRKKVVVKTTMGVIWILAAALDVVAPSPADQARSDK